VDVLVIGANGQIGRLLVEILGNGERHIAHAMVRDPAQMPEIRKRGGRPSLGDLEENFEDVVRGMDAVVFTAGSGAHTGPEKTIDVDQNGAIRAVDTCVALEVPRFVMVSSMGADDPESGPENIRHYLRAKHVADEHLRASGLQYTILRPGRLTDEPGTGRIRAGAGLGYGEIPRADVAEAIALCLDMPETQGRIIELLSGDTPIRKALAQEA